jgi:hypothetical protein
VACSTSPGSYCPGCGVVSLVGSSPGLGTSANGLLLFASGGAWGSYQALPASLTGLACTTEVNDSPPLTGMAVSVSLNAAATMYLLLNRTIWTRVDLTGYGLTTTMGGAYFVNGAGSGIVLNVYQKQVTAGAFAIGRVCCFWGALARYSGWLILLFLAASLSFPPRISYMLTFQQQYCL